MLMSGSFAVLLAWAVAAAPPEGSRVVTQFIGEDVVVVARCDLEKLDIEALAKRLIGPLADKGDDLNAMAATGAEWVSAMKKAGAKEIYVLVDPADMPGPPIAVVPLSEGADAKKIGEILCAGGPGKAIWPTCASLKGALFAGSNEALERIKAAQPADRPDLAAVFSAAGSAPVQIMLVPSASQRRVLEEAMPNLPKEFGGAPTTTLTKGLTWAVISLETEPKPNLRALVQAKDATSAKALLALGKDAFKLLEQSAQAQPPLAAMIGELAKVKPEVKGDLISYQVDLASASELVKVPVQQAREAARRAQCTNNLKQMGLAMHNFHSTHNTFPPAFNKSKDGKPLLSWRVHILPFLDQEALYKEFHLNEAWDSPHNKPLISRMPKVYACPDESAKLAAAGKTTYLTPRGKGTIFPGDQAIKLSEVTDGTSNTIMTVDAADDSAVVWTKPDDWEFTEAQPAKGLFGHHPGGTNIGFADGSVRFLKDTINPRVLLNLTTRAGGEVISADDF